MKTLAPDDIVVGDLVTVVNVENVHPDAIVQYTGEPSTVTALDLPFLVVENAIHRSTYDMRVITVARVSREYYTAFFGANKKNPKSKGVKCPHCQATLRPYTIVKGGEQGGSVAACEKCTSIFV